MLLLPGVFIFCGIFVQALAGFGSALIAMPLLIGVLGVQQAATLFALVVGTAEILLLLHYRHALRFGAVRRLALASAVGIPVGLLGLAAVPEQLMLLLLGLVVLGYGIYGLSGLQMPPLQNPRWGYGFGFVAGVFSGAYNTGGPPLVMYGTGRRWQPGEFKGNLQAVFVINTALVLLLRGGVGYMTPQIWLLYALALPFMALALLLGFALEPRVSPQRFRRLVLLLLLLLGLKLIFVDSCLGGLLCG